MSGRRIRHILTLCGFLLLASCASSLYSQYRDDMFTGRNLLDQGAFREARDRFVRAASEQNRAAAYAFAATASYKLGDYQSAGQFISNAGMAPSGNYVQARIKGYRALTCLAQGKKEEGFAALKDYIDYYRQLYPLMSIERVERMRETGDINMKTLEKLIDEEVNNYEAEVTQAVTTGTGYYASRPPAGLVDPGFTIY